MMGEKIILEVETSVEYLLNLTSKHKIQVNNPISNNCKSIIRVRIKDKEKIERLLNNYGKKYKILKIIGYGINVKIISKRIGFLLGLIIALLSISIYSISIDKVVVLGCNSIDEQVIKSIVTEHLKTPIFVVNSEIKDIENHILQVEGISYVAIKKEGRSLEVNIIEELSKTQIIDTQNLISIKSTEDGVVTKIIVNGGTPLVAVGEEVKKGQALIAPYLENAEGDRKQTLAIGKVIGKVNRVVELKYSSQKEYEEKFLKEYEELTAKVKGALSSDDKFLGTHFLVKNLDKSMVCSIYYELITCIT